MYSIGVDVGGTGIKIGVVDESGNILLQVDLIKLFLIFMM